MRPPLAVMVAILFAVGLASANDDEADTAEALRTFVELARPLSSRAPIWFCKATRFSTCAPSGCESSDATIGVFVDLQVGRYLRCIREPSGEIRDCGEHPASVTVSGIYTTVAPVDGTGTSIKILNDGSEFLDVASLGTTAYVSHGSCDPVERSK